MDALKKYAFLIINGVIFLATLVLYFLSVSGRRGELEKIENKLEKDRKSLITLSSRKPTQRWYDIVDKNMDKVRGGLQSIENGPRMADQVIHRFFDLSNPAELTDSAPGRNTYPVFKEMMVKKWDSMAGAFCGEEGPFGLEAKVLSAIEPPWLRSDSPPTHEQQVIDAMKSYWITTDLLEVLSESKVEQLSALTLSPLRRNAVYQLAGKDFWGYRDIVVEGGIQMEDVEGLFRAFSETGKLYRVTGFSFENVISTPPEIQSDASFLKFSESRPQVFKLNLLHFDYLSEGESFEEIGMTSGPGSSSSRRTGKSGRRRR
jgi:hypothetical protein